MLSLSPGKTQWTILLTGIASLLISVFLQKKDLSNSGHNKDLQKFPIQAFVSGGHHEFAWTLIAINGLAATVNAWSTMNDTSLTPSVRQNILEKFKDSLDALPGLAGASLGMREVFTFPTSFLAFELNDIDKAVEVAREGAKDPRLEVDLALSIAYLSHLFKGDLKEAAADYERLLIQFPELEWLKNIVRSLKAGIDPFKRPGRTRDTTCKLLAQAFPLAKRRLVERGTCTQEQIQEEMQK